MRSAATPPAVPRRDPISVSLAGRLGFVLTTVYLFFEFSRLQEALYPVLPLRWNLTLGIVLLPLLALSGGVGTILRSRVGQLKLAFIGWMALCIPFSRWRGGSAALFATTLKGLIAFLLILAFIRTFRQCMIGTGAVALGLLCSAIAGLVFGEGESGRLVMWKGTLGDPNYFALYVAIGLPLLFLWPGKGMRRMLWAPVGLAILISLMAILRTGSRGGLINLAAGACFLIWHLRGRQKLFVLTGMAALLPLVLFTNPSDVWSRFQAIYTPEARPLQDDMQISAAQSWDVRRRALLESIALTIQNPVFGTGPGMFMIRQADIAEGRGERGLWRAAHNTYTQFASETGIPGLLLTVLLALAAYRPLTKVRAGPETGPREDQFKKAALCVQTAMVIGLVGGLSLSLPYASILDNLFALSASLAAAWTAEFGPLKSFRSAAPQAQPAVPPGVVPAFHRLPRLGGRPNER